MPAFGANHPRHPMNRVLRLHAAVRLLQDTGELPSNAAYSSTGIRKIVMLACAAGGREHANRQMELMEDVGLIAWERASGKDPGRVEFAPDAAREAILQVPA